MSGYQIGAVRRACIVLAGIFLSAVAAAQGIPDDRNVNVIGDNPPTGGLPDTGLKQQNEAACSQKPSNPLHIVCAFNDYRGVDNPLIGDAWEGWSWTLNGGLTWFSDLLPGHRGDSPNLNLDFAADPQVAAAPGIALISYIAANRGENGIGGLYTHRMFERNQEDGAPWAPEMLPVRAVKGTKKKFVDKPFQLLHLAPPGTPNIVVSSTLKDGTAVSQELPAARLFLGYTVFKPTKSELMVSYSDNYGETWKTKKLSKGKTTNQSATLAARQKKALR